jgi:hypothetical protein
VAVFGSFLHPVHERLETRLVLLGEDFFGEVRPGVVVSVFGCEEEPTTRLGRVCLKFVAFLEEFMHLILGLRETFVRGLSDQD